MAESSPAAASLRDNDIAASAEMGDSRLNDLYATEHRSLSFRETYQLLVKSCQFFAPHRRLVILKSLIAIGSMLFFLRLPMADEDYHRQRHQRASANRPTWTNPAHRSRARIGPRS